MSIKKTIATLALTGLAAFGFASASDATPAALNVPLDQTWNIKLYCGA